MKVDGVGTINPSRGLSTPFEQQEAAYRASQGQAARFNLEREIERVNMQKFLHAGSDNQRQAAAVIAIGGYR